MANAFVGTGLWSVNVVVGKKGVVTTSLLDNSDET